MIDDGVGTDQQHHLRLHHVHHRIRHRSRADSFEQRGHAGRVTQARTVIDIVCSKARAHELLEEIRFFVRTLGGPESGKRIAPARISNPPQSTSCQLQRLVPARLAEGGHRIGRVHHEVRGFRHAGLADERPRETLRVMHVVKAEAPLDAQALVVRGAVAPFNVHDTVVRDVIGQLTTDTAIRTQRFDTALGRHQICVLGGRERARRAGLHAFTAGNAGGGAHRIAEVEDDL